MAVPRYAKMSFPTYDGKEDPLGWLNRCDRFFRAQFTSEIEKVGIASFHLTGVAQQWYFILERDTGEPSWELFKQLCHQRFGPPLRTNHLAELARLPFSSTVAAYQEAFLARLAHAGRLDPLQQAQLFMGGLPDSIRIDVELHEPRDLQSAMSLARAFERRNTTRPLALPAPPARPQAALPANTYGQDTPATKTSPAPRPFKKLTPSEMVDRCKLGLCYNCDEPYARGHQCQHLSYLEVPDYVVEEPEDDSPVASAPAVEQGGAGCHVRPGRPNDIPSRHHRDSI